MQNRVLSMLSITAKAGKIASGGFTAEQAVKSGKAYLVIASVDASDNTKKEFSDMAAYYGIPYREYGSKEELGSCIGKQFRAVLAVTDEKLAQAVLSKLEL